MCLQTTADEVPRYRGRRPGVARPSTLSYPVESGLSFRGLRTLDRLGIGAFLPNVGRDGSEQASRED
ncbi:hypothetical protein GCM10025762_53300 [Haloechinothrix salitolerans]